MGSEIDIRLTGTEALTSLLRRLASEVETELEQALKEIAADWAEEAQRRVPVRTGTLRETILHESGQEGAGRFFAAVGSNQPYAPQVEFGTASAAGDEGSDGGGAFLRPAFDAQESSILERLEKVLERAL